MAKNLLLSAAFCVGILTASAADYSLPFEFAMDTQAQFDQCAVISNEGKWTNTWEFNTTDFKCDYDTSTASDDWLIVPAVDFGKSSRVRISIEGRKDISNQKASFEVWMGREATVEAMTVEAIDVSQADMTAIFQTFQSEIDTEGGIWYVGIHVTSPSFSTAVRVRNLRIESLAEGNPDVVPVTGIILDNTEISGDEGDVVKLAATVEPQDATDKTVVWASSDESVATVADGVVTLVAEGTATITASCGEFSAVCHVTVSVKNGVEDISVENGVAEYYNLQGIRLSNPVKGDLVIERRGDKTRKVRFMNQL